MSFKFAFIFLGFYASLVATEESSNKSNDAVAQEILDRMLADGYDPRYPPEGNNGHGSPLEVFVRVYFTNIYAFSENSMYFSTQFYFSRGWNDSRLKYHHKDIKSIRLTKVDKIWIPDLFFEEEKAGYEHNLAVPNFFIAIEPTGEIFYNSRLSMTFACPMDLRKFPHDSHKCIVTISSYGYDTEKLIISWNKIAPLKVADAIDAINFKLIDITHSVKRTYTSANFTSLEVSLSFQRKTGFYVIRLFIPLILLVLLSWITFWMKPHHVVPRLIVLFTVFVLMISICSNISWYTPSVPYTRGSDVWIACCLSLVFAAILEFVLVLYLSNIHSSGKGDIEMESKAGGEKKNSVLKPENINSPAVVMALNILKLPWPERVDMSSRVLFPFYFILFNIVYWSVYCS